MATDSTALALLSRSPVSLGKPQKKDRDLWLMKKRGWSDDQLATRFNVSIDAVRKAVDRWELHRASFANDEIDIAINQMAVSLLPKAQRVLEQGMMAQKTQTVHKGKKVISTRVIDHSTRIKTLDSFKSLLEAVRPKGVGVQVNTQINNPANTPAAVPKGYDFESRLRLIRQEKGLTNDEGTLDADYEDSDPESALSDELAEIGIELPDDDEDDDDEEGDV
jgi:hypothetical protein